MAVLGDKNNAESVNNVTVPALKKVKAKTGSTAILTITGTDTTAAQAQLDSFIEKWKTEGVNMVFMSGNDASAKQFAETIKAAMPKVQLVTDTDTTLGQAQDEQKAGKKPNPYEGLLSGTGLTPTERWANKSPLLQQCVDIYQKATGTTVPGPDERKVDSNGKTVYTDQAVTDFCGELFMFRDIAKKVGPRPHGDELAEDGRHASGRSHSCPTSSPRCARASTRPRTASASCPTTRASARPVTGRS